MMPTQEIDSNVICQSLADTDLVLSRWSNKDINVFISYVLKDEKGRNVIQARIHNEIQWHIDECQRRAVKLCGILAPWGHGKTEQLVISRTLKFLGEDKNRRIFVVTNTDDNSKARVASISRYILEDKDYHKAYPDIKPADFGEWTKHKIIVERDSKSKDGSVEAWGITSSGTGARCDILLFDDPVDMRNAIQNPALRPVVKDCFKNVWIPRMVPTGFAIYIATVWHQDDNTSDLIKNPEWKFLIMKIAEDFNSIECESAFKGKFTIPLWSEWSKPRLMARHRAIGSRAFDRGFRQKAMTDEDRTFPSSEKIFRTDIGLEIARPEWARCVGIDPFGQFVVIFTLALSPEGRRIPISIKRGKWDSTRTVNELIDTYQKLMPQIIVVENNAAQDAIVQWAKEKGTVDMPIVPFTTGKQKADPILGLPSMEVEFANGAWVVPLGRVHAVDCECGFCVWRQELRDYPGAVHFDTVMASWFAREGARALMKPAEAAAPDVITGEEVGVEEVVIGGYD